METKTIRRPAKKPDIHHRAPTGFGNLRYAKPLLNSIIAKRAEPVKPRKSFGLDQKGKFDPKTSKDPGPEIYLG